MRINTGPVRLDAGFTLLEALVVLAIAVATLAVAMEFVSINNPRRELEQNAIALAAVMRGAQLTAVRSQRVSSFTFDLSKREFWSQADHTYVLDADTVATMVSARHAATDSALGQIRFMPNGQNSGATIRLTKDNETAVITADWLTGAIAVMMLP